jgi:hypothetical protein
MKTIIFLTGEKFQNYYAAAICIAWRDIARNKNNIYCAQRAIGC